MAIDLTTSPTSLSILETVLYAHDLAAIEDFYRRVLGLEPFASSENRHVFYRCGHQMLLIFNPEVTHRPPSEGALPVPPHGMEGQGHVCFRRGFLARFAAAHAERGRIRERCTCTQLRL